MRIPGLIVTILSPLVLIGIVAGVNYDAYEYDQQVATLNATLDKTSEEVEKENLLNLETATFKDELAATIELKTKMITVKEEALAEIANFATAEQSAKDKVDVAGERKEGILAQEGIYTATSVQDIEKSRDRIKELTVAVQQKVTNYDAEQARIAAERLATEEATRKAQQENSWNNSSSNSSNNSSSNNSGTSTQQPTQQTNRGNWFDEMRRILNDVGGGGYSLVEFDGHCGSVWAVACATPGVIKVHSDISGQSNWRKYWTMTHELAHQYQFNRWDELNSDQRYFDLFGGNPEKMANCMAALRGYSVTSCSNAQLDYARSYW